MGSGFRPSKRLVAADGVEAARILQRRLRGKVNYRKRRDKRIAVDLLGRDFAGGRIVDMLGGKWIGLGAPVMTYRVSGYDGDRATVVLAQLPDDKVRHTIGTDDFWRMIRRGELREV